MNKRIVYLIPAAFLLLISMFGFQIGSSGQWHSNIVEFWEKQDWHSIKALAENLDRTDRSDSESLYLAARAASIMQDQAAAARFSSRFLEKRALNWDAELWLGQNYKSQKLIEKIRLYRTRAVASILIIITIINLLVLWKSWNLLPWNAILASLGIVIAII
jgi:hypothetical protein